MLEKHLAFMAAAKSMRLGICVFGAASAAAVWIFAESIAMRRRERQYEVRPEMGLIWSHT